MRIDDEEVEEHVVVGSGLSGFMADRRVLSSGETGTAMLQPEGMATSVGRVLSERARFRLRVLLGKYCFISSLSKDTRCIL